MQLNAKECKEMPQFLFCTCVLFVIKLECLSQSQIHITTVGQAPNPPDPFWGL